MPTALAPFGLGFIQTWKIKTKIYENNYIYINRKCDWSKSQTKWEFPLKFAFLMFELSL